MAPRRRRDPTRAGAAPGGREGAVRGVEGAITAGLTASPLSVLISRVAPKPPLPVFLEVPGIRFLVVIRQI